MGWKFTLYRYVLLFKRFKKIEICNTDTNQ